MGPWLVEVRCREEFELWRGGGPPDRPHSTAMMVRGDGSSVRAFLPNALDAAKIDASRVVVWMRDPDTLDDEATAEIFGAGDWCLAVVLGADGTPAAWVSNDRTGVEDAEFAFAEAEKTKKVEISNA